MKQRTLFTAILKCNALHVIHRILDPRFESETTSSDAGSIVDVPLVEGGPHLQRRHGKVFSKFPFQLKLCRFVQETSLVSPTQHMEHA